MSLLKKLQKQGKKMLASSPEEVQKAADIVNVKSIEQIYSDIEKLLDAEIQGDNPVSDELWHHLLAVKMITNADRALANMPLPILKQLAEESVKELGHEKKTKASDAPKRESGNSNSTWESILKRD